MFQQMSFAVSGKVSEKNLAGQNRANLGAQQKELLGVQLGLKREYEASPMTSSSPSSSQITMRSSSLVMSSLAVRWEREAREE